MDYQQRLFFRALKSSRICKNRKINKSFERKRNPGSGLQGRVIHESVRNRYGWVVSIVEVDLLKHCRMKTLHFFLLWVFGFFLLLSFDLFMEGIVFEWLEWNGTTKNDWFFVLWWGVVVVWFLCGIITLYQRLKKWEKLLHSKQIYFDDPTHSVTVE